MNSLYYKVSIVLLLSFFFFYACKSSSIKKNNFHKGVKKKTENNYVLSSRFYHPRNKKDPQSTINAINKLKPKRIDWVYYGSNNELSLYQKLKLPYSLAINPQVPDSLEFTTKKYRIKELTGNFYIAPWMKTWKIKNPYWGCVNNPHFNKLFLTKALYLSSLKPYALFVDDAAFNTRLKKEKKIGCFCEHCVLLFKKKYKTNSVFDKNLDTVSSLFNRGILNEKYMSLNLKNFAKKYEDLQEESVIKFLKIWIEEIKKRYPKLKFLTNNYNGSWNSIYRVFDGGIAELNIKYINKKDLDSIYKLADSLNKTQLFSIASSNFNVQKRLLEYNAKNKRESLYPWDIFISGEKRYYMHIDSILKIKYKLKKN